MKQLAVAAGVLLLSASMLFAQNPAADKNASAPQSHDNQGKGISGRANSNAGDNVEVPVTTPASAGATTPGYQTEAGNEQKPGGNSDVPHTASATPGKASNANSGMGEIRKKTIVPPNTPDAGQSPQAADVNAQAAHRAEIEPGHTQGVAGQQGSMDHGSSAQSADLPQSDKSANGGKAKSGKTKAKGAKAKSAKSANSSKKADSQ